MLRSEKSEAKQSSIMLDTENSAIIIHAEVRKGGSEPGGWVSVVANAADNIEPTVYLAKKDSLKNVVKSKMIMDFYRHFASAPSTLIALLDIKMAHGLLTTFFEDEMDAETFAEGCPVKYAEKKPNNTSKHSVFIQIFSSITQKYVIKAPFLFSEKVEGYHDLGDDFVDQIKETGCVPEIVDGLPLQGFMRIAAIAKALEDCDWLGSRGGNTGCLKKHTKDGVLVAEAVLVDEKALTPVPLENNASDQDIVIGAQSGIYIKYDLLTPAQKEEFLTTLFMLQQLTEKDLRTLLAKKEYDNLFAAHLPLYYVSSLIKQIKKTIAKQCSLYEKDLKIIRERVSDEDFTFIEADSSDEDNTQGNRLESPPLAPKIGFFKGAEAAVGGALNHAVDKVVSRFASISMNSSDEF